MARRKRWLVASTALLLAVLTASSAYAVHASGTDISLEPRWGWAWGETVYLSAMVAGGGPCTLTPINRYWQLGPVVVSLPVHPRRK